MKKWNDKKLVKNIMKYEEGLMEDKEVVLFFQYLVDIGMAWTLQGHYGRTAQYLIDRGFVEDKRGRTNVEH